MSRLRADEVLSKDALGPFLATEGMNVPAGKNVLEYVTISSTGNSQDFGDLTYSANRKTGCSDSHGGLS